MLGKILKYKKDWNLVHCRLLVSDFISKFLSFNMSWQYKELSTFILFWIISFFKEFYLSFREGREGERERNINVWLPLMHATPPNLACYPSMCPDWELNQQPFGSQASAQSTELHQPGLCWIFSGRNILLVLVSTLPLVWTFSASRIIIWIWGNECVTVLRPFLIDRNCILNL